MIGTFSRGDTRYRNDYNESRPAMCDDVYGGLKLVDGDEQRLRSGAKRNTVVQAHPPGGLRENGVTVFGTCL